MGRPRTTDLLFVYGTLLSGIDHPMGRRLRREARLVGPARVRGRLYRVSWYPGVVDGVQGEVVHGELYRLADPGGTLLWLDEFEGVTRGASSVTAPREYGRVVRDVTGPDGPVRAWVYLYRGVVVEARREHAGRWIPGPRRRRPG